MSVDFKKLLPTALRKEKWGQLAQAYQSLWDDLVSEKINPILTQFDIENATTTEIKRLFQIFGFNLSSYQGFCNTAEYYRREALTLAIRVLNKTARNSYLYTYFIYNLLGDVLPLYDTITAGLSPISDWWENNEFTSVIDTLDCGYDNILYYAGATPIYDIPKSTGFSNTTLDADAVTTLDNQSNIEAITRYLLLTFKYLFVEDATQFLSQYTIKGFVNDINQIKKSTEICFFEPELFVNFNNDNSVRETVYTDYDQTVSGCSQQAILISGSATDFYKYRLGTGAHSIIDDSITDVEVFSYEILASEMSSSTDTDSTHYSSGASYISYRKQFDYPQHLTEFSELAILNISGQCLAYGEFPIVKFPTTMNSNIQFSFQFF